MSSVSVALGEAMCVLGEAVRKIAGKQTLFIG